MLISITSLLVGEELSLRSSPNKPLYSQLFIKAYHFCKLTVDEDQLIIEVYDIDLNLIDQFLVDQR